MALRAANDEVKRQQRHRRRRRITLVTLPSAIFFPVAAEHGMGKYMTKQRLLLTYSASRL